MKEKILAIVCCVAFTVCMILVYVGIYQATQRELATTTTSQMDN